MRSISKYFASAAVAALFAVGCSVDFVDADDALFGDAEYQALFGNISGATIQNLGASGSVNVEASAYLEYIGGVVGYAVSTSTVTNCYNRGDVTGYSVVGGIAGSLDNTIMTYCYSKSTITIDSSSSNSFGDLAEAINGTTWISSCYGGTYNLVGGALSGNSSDYYDSESVGYKSSIGLESSEFVDLLNTDQADEHWRMDYSTNINDKYAILSWQ